MIKRYLEDIIRRNLYKGKALIILGARQTGKTTLINKFYKENREDAIFLNCDEPHVRNALSDATTVRLRSLLGIRKVVFIDEAQRVENIGLTLKLITDNLKEKQLIVTGSSSLDIANVVNEPLTGRKFEYFLYPVSFGEWSEYQTILEAHASLERILRFGMYPDVLMNPGEEVQILQNLAGSYLYKDILAFKDIRKPALLEKLLQALALQLGNEVSYSELANHLQVDKQTVERYIHLLEKAFIIFRLNPFSRNLRKEIGKMRKIYFWDLGIRNALISNFNPVDLRQDRGALWENFLVTERLKCNHYQQHYANYFFWRTYQQQEIDFIEEYGGKLHAYEFKWKADRKAKFPKAFLDAYPGSETTIITPDNYWEFLGAV